MITLNNGIIEVKILPKGVTFTSFKLLSDNINIITAYDDLNDYQQNDLYLGSCIGPLAGRTAKGSYDLELDLNDGAHHLHGGEKGISNQVFDVDNSNDKAVFTLKNDGIDYTITVSLDNHDLNLAFKAVPDKSRPINMTNHMYFNLLGSDSLDNHRLKVDALKVSLHNKEMLNDGRYVDVSNTVFDLIESKDLSDVLDKDHSQFEMTRHIDHTYIGQKLLIEANNKSLEVTGTMPGMHIYLSNFFDESFVDEHKRLAKNHSSIAIEPQYVPNDKNMLFYSKDKPFEESIVYRLTNSI